MQGQAKNEMDRHQRDETKDEILLGSAFKKLGLQITPSWTLVLGQDWSQAWSSDSNGENMSRKARILRTCT